MGKKLALGKGIASLLQETPNDILRSNLNTEVAEKEARKEPESNKQGVQYIPIKEIVTNPDQPRKIFNEDKLNDLSSSIKENGIIQPLIVSQVENQLILVAGERRLRAASMAGLEEVPVIVRKITKKEQSVFSIIENIQRDDLNCIEEALAYYHLISEFKLTQEEVAKKVGKDRSSVSNHLRILKLPREIIDYLQKSELSFGHAKLLVALGDTEKQINLAEKAVTGKLSVRELEKLITFLDNISGSDKTIAVDPEYTAKIDDMQSKLQSKTGLKIKINSKLKENKGTIQIKFSKKEEFSQIYDYLMGSH